MDKTNKAEELRILIVDEHPGRSAVLEQALGDGDCRCRVVAKLNSGEGLASQVQKYQPDVILIDLESPDRDILEQMHSINREQPRPIVMFAENHDSEAMYKAIKAGVSAYIVDGLESKRVKPIMEVAIARFREYQALREELAKAKDSLEERKLVERAKGLLMQHRGMSESEAHQALRKLAMDQGRKLGEAARSVIDVMSIL